MQSHVGSFFLLPGCQSNINKSEENEYGAKIAATKQPFTILALGNTVLERRHLLTNDGIVWAWGRGRSDTKGHVILA